MNLPEGEKDLEKKMVCMAMDYAQQRFSAEILSLAVFENNSQAVKCYEALGFEKYERDENARHFKGKAWPLLRMRKTV